MRIENNFSLKIIFLKVSRMRLTNFTFDVTKILHFDILIGDFNNNIDEYYS